MANEAQKITPGTTLISLERARQIYAESYDKGHDDIYNSQGQLMSAAADYIGEAKRVLRGHDPLHDSRGLPFGWPWEKAAWKPSPDPIRNLVKAGALIAAEIDRLQRSARERNRQCEVWRIVMTQDDIEFIKSMCFQGPEMTGRQDRRFRRILDDMRMLASQLAERDAEIEQREDKYEKLASESLELKALADRSVEIGEIALAKLKDAEARIAELEAQLATAQAELKTDDRIQDMATKAMRVDGERFQALRKERDELKVELAKMREGRKVIYRVEQGLHAPEHTEWVKVQEFNELSMAEYYRKMPRTYRIVEVTTFERILDTKESAE